jgi:hypothetical protein
MEESQRSRQRPAAGFLSLPFFWLLCASVPLWFNSSSAAAEVPSWSRQVRPFLARYCLECHNAKEAKGGLNLETYPSLRAGGDDGPVLVPGKADDSLLVRLVEHRQTPPMPPRKAAQPPARWDG